MNCPKDADNTDDKDMCREGNGYLCTRRKGHKGKHHAHALDGTCCKIW